MGRAKTIARRSFLLGSAAIAGGVVFGYWRYRTPYPNPLLDEIGEGEVALTPYVQIDASGVTVIAPRAEMGQGVHTTLAALVAEELELELDDIRVEHGPASKAYYNAVLLEEGIPFASVDDSANARRMRSMTHIPAKFMALQITGGSTSIPDGFVKMRKAGAAAREALLAAAAIEFGADAATLVADGGRISAADGRSLTYTELARKAADIRLEDDPPLKPREKWRLLGRSQARIDVPAKSTGKAVYSIDVRLPDMLYATVRMNPALGAGLRGFEASEARSMPGVIDVIELDGGIAVIASNTWYAMQAAKAVVCDWEPASYPADTHGHFDAVAAAFEDSADSEFRSDGNVDAALVERVEIEGEYRVPYLAHATLEPMNAVAWWRNGELDVWAGNQAPMQAQKDAAKIVGADRDRVRIHTTLMGGAFGRRAEMDFIKSAVHVAKAVPGRPVKTTWSREEDTTHDNYRPLAIARYRARGSGKPALDLRVAAPSVAESQFGRLGIPVAGPDITIAQSAWDQPYAIGDYRVRGYRAPVMLPISSWRSVGASQNGFFHECIIDEMAEAAGRDPLDFRLDLVDHEPSRKVIERVAEISGWGESLPPGRGRGIAFVLSFGVPVAEVIEVEETPAGYRILRAFAAADVGIALDPGNIEAQVQSGILFGLSAAMRGEIRVRDGQVVEKNFDSYDGIRLKEVPHIEVAILENGSRIRGIGEPGLPPAAPALANAIYAVSGQRLRELPLSKSVRFA